MVSNYSNVIELTTKTTTGATVERGEIKAADWNYNGKYDALCFETNKDCMLTAIGIFDADDNVTARLEIWNHDETKLLTKINERTFNCTKRTQTPIKFKLTECIFIKKSTKYAMRLFQKNKNGKPSYKIDNAKTEVTQSGFKVKFTKPNQSPNGTSTTHGAFPQLYFYF